MLKTLTMILCIAGLTFAGTRTGVVKVVGVDSSIVIKVDSFKVYTYDTIKIVKTIKDTIIGLDTVELGKEVKIEAPKTELKNSEVHDFLTLGSYIFVFIFIIQFIAIVVIIWVAIVVIIWILISLLKKS